MTQGQIADILQARGELDEALRICREEQLPVFERLGDVREKAVTQGKIADILQARGELDEALRIRREEQLPIYERLGDVREKAATQGKIADILLARGELDEALRIRTEEQLPVYERLGYVEGIAHGKFAAAAIRLARGDHKTGAIQAIHDDLAESFSIVRRLRQPDGIGAVGEIFANVLAMLGRRRQALQVLEKAKLAFKQTRSDSGLTRVRELRKRIKRQSEANWEPNRHRGGVRRR